MSRVFLVAFVALALLGAAVAYKDKPQTNFRPIIGILTQPSPSELTKYGKSYIPASYIKFFESAGARVVPIFHNDSPTDLKALFSKINGVFFPGGGSDLNHTPLFNAAQTLFNLAIQANDAGDYFPVMGHCQGYEILQIITSKDSNILVQFDAENIALPLNFSPAAASSRIFSGASPALMKIFSTANVTMNNHQWGTSPAEYQSNSGLKSFWTIVSTNADRNGKVFVSTLEGINYPVYALQWHAEKPLFEWDPDEVIPHNGNSTVANQFMADFYVSEARKNTHKFPSASEEAKTLIYNYNPVYTEALIEDFVQCYLFNK